MEGLRAIVTGAAGFLGSHLVDALMGAGWEVVGIDNLSSGSLTNLRAWLGNRGFTFIKADLKHEGDWRSSLAGACAVLHFAANPEVRISSIEPRTHFDENVVATFNVLEAVRRADVDVMVFASSSTVYGDPDVIPTPEDHPKKPISVYGASKLACEILIETYHRLYGLRALVLRYANIVGPRLSHGAIVDFMSKLRANPSRLEILGDGKQRKSYMYVGDAIGATTYLLEELLRGSFSFEAFNVGSEDWTSVVRIADVVVEETGLSGVEYVFRPVTPDGRGWPGDVKLMLLDVSKLKAMGWEPSMGSEEAIRKAVRALLKEDFSMIKWSNY